MNISTLQAQVEDLKSQLDSSSKEIDNLRLEIQTKNIHLNEKNHQINHFIWSKVSTYFILGKDCQELVLSEYLSTLLESHPPKAYT
jgi:hypothetical protein